MASKILAGAAVAFLMSMGATSAMAAACSSYAGGSSNPNPSTTDVQLTNSLSVVTAATDCYGEAAVSPNNLAAVTLFANTAALFDTAGQGAWTGVLRHNADAAAGTGSFGGLNFSLGGATGGATGTFTLTITDADLSNAPSLPARLDLVFTLKSSTATDFYFFDALSLDGSNPGSYSVSITNNQGVPQGLSDISVLARGPITAGDCAPTDPTCNPQNVPEPGSLALVGLALAAAGFARRRKA